MEEANRDSWSFEYTGQELLVAAMQKLDYHTEREAKAIRTSDRAEHKKIKDKCFIWAYEFYRQPDKKYTLSLDDVNFFELAIPIDAEKLNNTLSFNFITCRHVDFVMDSKYHLLNSIKQEFQNNKEAVKRIAR